MAHTTDPAGQTRQDAPAAEDTPATPVRTGLLAAAVFVLGLVVGAVTVALLDDDPVAVEVAATPEGDEAGAGPSFSAEDASAEFVVSGACLRAVNAAQDTVLVLDDLGEAATELDAARLDEIVRRLMPLQTRLETGLQACRVATELDAGGEQPEGSPASPTSASPPPEGDSGDGD